MKAQPSELEKRLRAVIFTLVVDVRSVFVAGVMHTEDRGAVQRAVRLLSDLHPLAARRQPSQRCVQGLDRVVHPGEEVGKELVGAGAVLKERLASPSLLARESGSNVCNSARSEASSTIRKRGWGNAHRRGSASTRRDRAWG